MSDSSEHRLVDDQLAAFGHVGRRRLLLELWAEESAEEPAESPHVEFGGLDYGGDRDADGLDPLVALRHLHIPVLEDHGLVRWNPETRRVTRGPRFEEAEPLLEQLRGLQDELPGRWV